MSIYQVVDPNVFSSNPMVTASHLSGVAKRGLLTKSCRPTYIKLIVCSLVQGKNLKKVEHLQILCGGGTCGMQDLSPTPWCYTG